MPLPVDPTLDCSIAKYSLHSKKPTLTNNMQSTRPGPQQPAQGATEAAPTPKTQLERFRDYLGRTCCSCFYDLPVVVIVVGLCILIALLLALIPAVIMLTSAVDKESQLGDGEYMEILRDSHIFPNPDPMDDGDAVLAGLRSDGIHMVHGIPSTALFPPNVSLCQGFGFACTNQPSFVISTSLRCDGKSDCPDGSDELNCRECQSAFSCSKSRKSKVKICLRAEQLCDGVSHCPNGYDEKRHCKKSCRDGEIKCSSKSLCVPASSICDGIADCESEEDELNCKECSRGAKMCKPLKRCLPPGQLCDGFQHCPDGSDEQDCDCRSCCGTGKALCSDGTCIDRSRICDGIKDCRGGQDEEGCPGSCIMREGRKVQTMRCADGRRYPLAEACTGVIEQCAYNCSKCDEKMAFTCSDRKCIPRMLVCDGINDCTDGGDELNCNCEGADNFECHSASGKKKCLPKSKVCDGVWDCMDGKDESNCGTCPSNSIRCPTEGKCIPKLSRCDGTADCKDGFDETGCTCDECIGKHWNTYMCGSSSRCFRRDEVCAPYTLCPNATKADKVYCAGRALRGVDMAK